MSAEKTTKKMSAEKKQKKQCQLQSAVCSELHTYLVDMISPLALGVSYDPSFPLGTNTSRSGTRSVLTSM
jgi:hypothetical protein